MGVDLNFNHFSVLAYADDISKEALLNNLADSIQHFKLAIELY